jgi:hypothetical protein
MAPAFVASVLRLFEVMMRRSVEPMLGSALAAAVVAISAMGCAENESSLFVRQVQARVPPECAVNNDPQSLMMLRGTLDVALKGNGYLAPLLVGNQLVSRGSGDELRTESARVSLHGAVVRIDDSAGNTIDEFTVDGTGFVDPGDDTGPGYGILAATLIPPGTGELGAVTVWVKVFGRTLGGKELESNELSFPMNVCNGCLISYPSEYNEAQGPGYLCAVGTGATMELPCLVGQDAVVPCMYCSGVIPKCRNPAAP